MQKNDEYFVIKVSSPININFFDEHQKVLDKYGYVDFAKVGRSKMIKEKVSDSYKFIKDNKLHGDKVCRAKVADLSLIHGERKYPEYYQTLCFEDMVWIRLVDIEEFSYESLKSGFITRNNKLIEKAVKSMVLLFYIKKKDNQ